MIDLSSLVKKTNAYQTVKKDKANGTLSHAYLIVCADGENLDQYLKTFAKLIVCKSADPCNECRACSLIDQGNYSDVLFFPMDGESVMTSDVAVIVSESYVKPIENDKKLFVISKGQTMNASSQNKLLKTLEEPPVNVHILIGSTSEYPLLATVKSRVKRLDIPPFTAQEIFDALKDECKDEQRLKEAIACGDGTIGKTLALYQDESLKKTMDFAKDMLTNMQSSKDVLRYAVKITENKTDFLQLVSVLEVYLRDLLTELSCAPQFAFDKNSAKELKTAKGFTEGAVIAILEDLTKARERKAFNANPNMLTEWLLFKILEEKFKWQK